MLDEALKKAVLGSKYLVALCGSGMLKEYGQLSMRDPDRAYEIEKKYGYSPEEMFTSSFYSTRPDRFFEFYRNEILAGEENPGEAFYHLADLSKCGKLKCVITNNVYSYPEKAGCENVVALHGDIEKNYCPHCKEKYPKEYILSSKSAPRCSKCGALLRPGLIFFGQTIDNAVMSRATAEVSKADVLLVLGSSLRVEPARQYARYFEGDHLVVVNPVSDYSDIHADLVIHEPVAETLKKISGWVMGD